ncbi:MULTISPECIES: hypothetical protein [unclassified Streptomyces]|uniref:hypothetical protein n=1 Tax=unclassified Streptomyces TaxID=2593676 RepID=UPI002E766C38|nr:hypothetical protein [Streptomyces sp. JV184]MEE1745720.1 hypothetical protein [Streptomyces sp. JV184]
MNLTQLRSDLLDGRTDGVDLVGLHGPDAGDRVGDIVRVHRSERRGGGGGLARDDSSGMGAILLSEVASGPTFGALP